MKTVSVAKGFFLVSYRIATISVSAVALVLLGSCATIDYVEPPESTNVAVMSLKSNNTLTAGGSMIFDRTQSYYVSDNPVCTKTKWEHTDDGNQLLNPRLLARYKSIEDVPASVRIPANTPVTITATVKHGGWICYEGFTFTPAAGHRYLADQTFDFKSKACKMTMTDEATQSEPDGAIRLTFSKECP